MRSRGISASVKFRGEDMDVTIDSFSGGDSSTNAGMEIEWHFDDMSPEQTNALKITDKEDDDLYQQLAEFLGEHFED